MEKIKQLKIIKTFPDSPGVYFFKRAKGKNSEILYVGKATSLRDRVKSYFNPDIAVTRSPLISKMLSEFDEISYQKTDSVLEALVLEAHLIKKYQPEANIKEKDNRSFNFVVITKEDFPRVLVVRGRELEKFVETPSRGEASQARSVRDLRNFSAEKYPYSPRDVLSKNFSNSQFRIAYSFGPFPNGSQLREGLKIVRKLFPYRDKCIPASELKPTQKSKPCFNRQIGLCPGVCTGEISNIEYAQTIKNIILFFESDKKKLVKSLEKQMKDFAKARQFEKAQKIKKTIFTLSHIQDISLIKDDFEKTENRENFRIESYDIAHFAGTHVVGVMTVMEDGEAKPSNYRKFKIRDNPGVNDTKALAEILSRRLAHIEWPSADLIVVDGGIVQKKVMEKILKEHEVQTPVVSVVKDERHRPKQILGDKKWLTHERDILLSNSEAHRFALSFHKKLRGKI